MILGRQLWRKIHCKLMLSAGNVKGPNTKSLRIHSHFKLNFAPLFCHHNTQSNSSVVCTPKMEYSTILSIKMKMVDDTQVELHSYLRPNFFLHVGLIRNIRTIIFPSRRDGNEVHLSFTRVKIKVTVLSEGDYNSFQIMY